MSGIPVVGHIIEVTSSDKYKVRSFLNISHVSPQIVWIGIAQFTLINNLLNKNNMVLFTWTGM